MHIEKLCEENAGAYLEYLKKAFSEEPEMMTCDGIDEQAILQRLRAQTSNCCTSLLAVDGGAVLGRIEYHFYTCLQDGYKMAYVNWIYVLKDHRRLGIAGSLFRAFEGECAANGVNEYFLLCAENESASSFYGSFPGAVSSSEKILRKTL